MSNSNVYSIHRVYPLDLSIGSSKAPLPLIAKKLRVYMDPTSANIARIETAIQYYHPSNITELSIKCAKKLDKTDVHYVTSSDMKFESNPVDDDMAYW